MNDFSKDQETENEQKKDNCNLLTLDELWRLEQANYEILSELRQTNKILRNTQAETEKSAQELRKHLFCILICCIIIAFYVLSISR